jgi:ubiquinone/menaquinone biosynthesis C-methylase UbiE
MGGDLRAAQGCCKRKSNQHAIAALRAACYNRAHCVSAFWRAACVLGLKNRRSHLSIALWLLLGLLLLAFLYWLIVVGEGTYLGRAAVRLIYQLGAGVYDQARANVTASDEAVLLPLLRAALVGTPGPRVLDVATGTARVPLLLVAQPWFDGAVDGLDLTPAMLARAQAKIDAVGLAARVALRQGDAGNLPWSDARFDLVISLEALEFFPRPRRALAEMSRVLRPGGVLIVSKYPDQWARVLPFKGVTRRSMTRLLERLGLAEIAIRAWQPGHYELVTARKVKSNE